MRRPSPDPLGVRSARSARPRRPGSPPCPEPTHATVDALADHLAEHHGDLMAIVERALARQDEDGDRHPYPSGPGTWDTTLDAAHGVRDDAGWLPALTSPSTAQQVAETARALRRAPTGGDSRPAFVT